MEDCGRNILRPHVTLPPHLPHIWRAEVQRTGLKGRPHGHANNGPLSENESLQATLAVAIGQMKGQHAMISALMAEVAALRKTVAEKPENADLYESNLKAARETAKPFVDDAMRTCHEMIELLCSTDVLKN